LNPIITEAIVDADTLASVLRPRDGVVAETADPSGVVPVDEHRFSLAEGPLAAYQRTVIVSPADTADSFAVRQEVSFTVGLWVWSWLFLIPLRRTLSRIGLEDPNPWWAPPQRVDRAGATNLAALCGLSVIIGYLDSLVPQTMTYIGGEYHVGTTGQGIALGVVQVSALLAVAALAVADRQGRRPLALGCVVAGIVLTAVGGLAPSLGVLVASQVLADGLVGAGYLLVIVIAAEEMPAGGRAWAAGLVSLSYGLGAGVDLLLLPLAGASPGGWRWLYVLALCGFPGLVACSRRLGESRRFVTPTARVASAQVAPAQATPKTPGQATPGQATPAQASPPTERRRTHSLRGLSPLHRRRLVLFGATAILFALFATPASQFQNQYLRTERHFSATHISVLSQIAGTIGGLAVLAGGRLADTWGRRPVAALGVAAGTAVSVFGYLSGGWALWVWVILGSCMSYGIGPALSVYGPELFPSGIRSTAAGVLGALGAAGGVIGLLAAAGLSDAIGTIAPALAVLAVGPALMVILVVMAYPETARRPLETLNPGAQPPG
jgi:MFS family permease